MKQGKKDNIFCKSWSWIYCVLLASVIVLYNYAIRVLTHSLFPVGTVPLLGAAVCVLILAIVLHKFKSNLQQAGHSRGGHG